MRRHTAGVALPSEDLLKAWWSGPSFADLTPQVGEVSSHGGTRLVCTGTVLDRDGQEVGEWRRDVVDEEGVLRVEHRELKIDDAVQDDGFGRPWYWHCEKQYREAGVHVVEMHAEDVGGYVWATCGFVFATGACRAGDEPRLRALAACDVLDQRRHALDDLVGEGVISQQDADAFVGRFADRDALFARAPVGGAAAAADLDEILQGRFTDPGEIARYGNVAAWLEGERKMWLGKAFLIGSTWLGTKTL